MQQSYTVAPPALNSGSLSGLHPERQEVVDNAEFVFQLLFTIELVFKVFPALLPLVSSRSAVYQLLSSVSSAEYGGVLGCSC